MVRRLVTIATTNLNQWALDWEGNLARIKQSIVEAKSKGARLRVGPELEVCGYGCLDHYLESDVYEHSMEMLYEIMKDRSFDDIVIDIGMPVQHQSLRFNCRVIILNGKILLIRPKLFLANDGNYREMRYFTPSKPNHLETFTIPSRRIIELHGSSTCPFGDALLRFDDTTLGVETCEELFTPNAPHILMGLNGAEIFSNASGSHHALRKLDQRLSLIREATAKNGGVYIYANQQGMDGDRLYYDGCSTIICNSDIVARGSQFSLNDVEVVTATIDLKRVVDHRFAPSRGMQAVAAPTYESISVPFALCGSSSAVVTKIPTSSLAAQLHAPEEEIALGPAAWLWDYLRRSKAAGFLIPLSGGLDSCSTATLVFSMCRMVFQALEEGNEQVRLDVKRIAGAHREEGWMPKSPQDLCNTILHTVYMAMSKQSSEETSSRAARLSEAIGSYHLRLEIDDVFHAERDLLKSTNNFTPTFEGSTAENIALQNIQARTRMVTAYYYAQMLPTVRQRKGGGSLLVLGSANCDEALRGYYTKYDASAADINPIGSISKVDLKKFLAWAESEFSLPILHEFLDATPTAELQPITEDYTQSDEADMGMTYAELSVFGKLRKEERLGAFGMFERLLEEWGDQHSPREIAVKVKRFIHFYSINRHKMTILTPSYHAESYSPDDNRFDLRPFCYPGQYDGWAFKKIDEEVERIESLWK
ncbi:unnamed protein product [Periconia digitata]|uniref:Glutamine-dependent NAD(+) synthetase n=1 Tax=Periconia digitata TaxID=1303443 RepID=A0A9W4U6U7_9PLEO|nr:unnamed protein product [Periconia digitata]